MRYVPSFAPCVTLPCKVTCVPGEYFLALFNATALLNMKLLMCTLCGLSRAVDHGCDAECNVLDVLVLASSGAVVLPYSFSKSAVSESLSEHDVLASSERSSSDMLLLAIASMCRICTDWVEDFADGECMGSTSMVRHRLW